MPDSEQLKGLVSEALEEMKAIEPVCLDVREATSVTDFMVIVTGSSSRHVRSLAEHVVTTAKKSGLRPLGVEGDDAAEWVLVDFGDVVVHVMQDATRRFYNLERLWGTPEQRGAEA